MIRNTILILPWLLAAFSLPNSLAQAEPQDPTTRLIDTRSNADCDFAHLVAATNHCDVLFLGELHDSDPFHAFQLEVIKALHESGRDIAISMEMFERDVQGVVDDYLAGRIDETQFKAHSRPWKNYDKHYRPIIEYAKKNKLAVIAGNVPRTAASELATGKSKGGIDSPFVARSTSAGHDAYYQRFLDIMQGHGGTDDEEAMDRMYKAQCLKDDTMAESIVDFLDVNPHRQPLVVHLCGNFHSDYGHGTAMRVLTRRPLLDICVVTMRNVDDVSRSPDEVDRSLADFVLLVKKKQEEEKTVETSGQKKK